jgi:hypothetical protein
MSKAQELKALAHKYADAKLIRYGLGAIKNPPDPGYEFEKLEAAIDAQQSIIDEQRAEIERLTSPDVETCPVCGSDCNERDELVKAEREIERLTKDAEAATTLIRECLAALGEELSAWDTPLPIHHIKKAHDNCQKWLDRAAIAAGSQTEVGGGV